MNFPPSYIFPGVGRKVLLGAAFATAMLTAGARTAPTVLTVADHLNDSTIVYPESVETDTHKMLQNWYLQTYTALDRDVEKRPDPNVSDEEYIERLSKLPTIIEMPFNSIVKAYIQMYTSKNRSLVENMLGMSLYYMPIFEQALEREGLPNELKYLPVIESALNPDAVSRAGATGLWQIMIPTAQGLGLEVNTIVDERRDPIRSSETAAQYLKQLYGIYNDWSLAIAAYNCGPGNINKALRRCPGDDKKDFWDIYPYLPQETRGYLPCFIAANYVMNYYPEHNISPALARRPILTDSVHVNQRVYFKQIADILRVPMEELQVLNPQYRQDFIPGDIKPYALVLPANQIPAYIVSEDAIISHDSDLYARRQTVEPASADAPRAATVDGVDGEWVTTEDVQWHKVKRGENLTTIAKKYGLTLAEVRQANGNIRKAKRGQSIKIVATKQEFRPYPAEQQEPASADSQPLLAQETQAADASVDTATGAAKQVADAFAQAPAADTAPAKAQPSEAKSTSKANVEKTPAKQAEKNVASNTSKSKKDAAKSSKSTKTAKAAKEKEKEKSHTVRKGDTMADIAKANGLTVQQLQKLNPGVRPKKIKPGDKLRVK